VDDDEFTEPTPFEEAFPEACGIHDKLADIIDKVQSGEMSMEEAKASLQEVKEINSAIRRKMSHMRKSAPH
jgi:polyhydroxyalkanoate synthesis regulator phasin